MPIKVLSPEVTSKIAAGEVIERPSSVVKELIENSLDARATEISIEAHNGGISYLRVTDNGCGLSAAEAEIAVRRHATSKIAGLDDLEHISTLGFRGEALPSIASVAEMEILTRDQGSSAASYLHLENSRITGREKKSRPQGTTVTVRRLFQNFPARLKFLKSAATESGHIAALVSQFALAYPEVKFDLVVDGRTALRTAGDAELRSAVSVVYGLDTAKKMLEVEGTDSQLYIQGLASPPSVQRSSRSYLSFFVNRRYVRNSILAKAVETAYEGLLMSGRHPLAVLNITVPLEEVDVNVHPTKLEVKFRNNSSIFTAIVKALRDTLARSPLPSARPDIEEARRGLRTAYVGTSCRGRPCFEDTGAAFRQLHTGRGRRGPLPHRSACCSRTHTIRENSGSESIPEAGCAGHAGAPGAGAYARSGAGAGELRGLAQRAWIQY